MLSEWWWIGKYLLGSGSGLILRYCPGIRLEGLRKSKRGMGFRIVTLCTCRQAPTFRRNILPSLSEFKSTRHYNPEDQHEHVHTERRCRVLNIPASYSAVPGSNLGPGTIYSVWCFSWLFSVTPGECWDCTLKLGHERFLQNPLQFIFHL
jgi:hypothetical protein